MFTTSSEKQAIRALQTFEQVRYFFSQLAHPKTAPDTTVRVIAFSSEKEYKPYRLNEGAFAYYLQSRQRDYIVMQDIAPEHSQTAFHEYTHLVVRHMNLNLPVWLNEGLADFYSSLEPDRDKAVVGRPIPGRVITLFNEPWIDWHVLFTVDQNSPYYNENAKMSIFYAQSWALTHMLITGAGYRQSFSRFLATVAGGDSTEHALVTVYGKSIKDIDTDLHLYVKARTVNGLVFDVKLPKSDLDPESEALPDMQRDLALADLLASQASKASKAKSLLETLASEYSQSPDVQESLGYLFWQEGDVAQARAHFRSAFELHSRNPKMLLSYAQMETTAGVVPANVIPVLQQALTLDPANNGIRLELAAAALNNQQYGYALSTLSVIKSIRQEDAFRFFTLQAFSWVNIPDAAAAKDYAERALQYAKTPAERSQLDDLLSYLKRDESTPHSVGVTSTRPATESLSAPAAPVRPTLVSLPGLPRVKGRTKALECVPGGGLRLHLQVEDHEMVFALPDPTQIIVTNAPGNAVHWSCGDLNGQDVTVVYDAASTAAKPTSGELKELVF